MLAAMVGTLWLATRSARLVAAILTTIVAGLIVTTALGLLAVGRLNLISVAFIPLFVGLCVDFGIQICVRFNAEREDGTHQPATLWKAVRNFSISSSVPIATRIHVSSESKRRPTATPSASIRGMIS